MDILETLRENTVPLLIIGLLVFTGATLSLTSNKVQWNECNTVTSDYNVECSDVDIYADGVRGASQPNTSIAVQLSNIDAQPYGDEAVYVPYLYYNGFAAGDDYGSSIGDEDLNLEEDTLQKLADNSKCQYSGSMRFRDDDVFITTSEGEFNFDNDPENPGEQNINELTLGQASITTNDVRIVNVNDANADIQCVFDLHDIAAQAVEAEYPGEFESIRSYGGVVLTGTVTTDFSVEPETSQPVNDDDNEDDGTQDPGNGSSVAGGQFFVNIWNWFTGLF